MMNNNRRSLGKRYSPREIELVEQLRLAVIERKARQADEDAKDKDTSFLDSLPPLPPEPKDNEKRVIVIKKRGKAE